MPIYNCQNILQDGTALASYFLVRATFTVATCKYNYNNSTCADVNSKLGSIPNLTDVINKGDGSTDETVNNLL